LGYLRAGFNELLAIDLDIDAMATFVINFPDIPVWRKDIRDVGGDEILRFCGLPKGGLGLLDGSPPCQGFSISGKRIVSDSRNDLFGHNIRLIREIEPKAFVIENVPGMAVGRMRGIFNGYMRALRALPYCVRCRLMNAARHGVPQARRRLVWLGVRNDLSVIPEFPIGDHRSVTVREALRGCPRGPVPKFDDRYAKLWWRVEPGRSAVDVIGKGYNSCYKIHPDRPAPVLPALQTGRGFATVCHWAEPRALSIAEAKRLQSFPDGFTISGGYQSQWRQLGNSVPPKLMEAVAVAMGNVLGGADG